jgi:hypothetical protein
MPDTVILLLLLSAAVPLAVLLVLAIRRVPAEPQKAPELRVMYLASTPLTDAQIEARVWRVEGVLAAHKSQCGYATTDGRSWLLTGPNAERTAMELKEEIALSIGDSLVEVRG